MELKWKLLGIWWRLRGFNPPVMARTVELGPEATRVDVVRTYETEYPYRPGRGLVLHLYGSHGVLLAILQPRVDLDDAAIDGRLLEALRATEGTSTWRAKAWRDRKHAGTICAANAMSEAEAREFSDMLGLDDAYTKVVPDAE